MYEDNHRKTPVSIICLVTFIATLILFFSVSQELAPEHYVFQASLFGNVSSSFCHYQVPNLSIVESKTEPVI